MYVIKNVSGHIQVYNQLGEFLFSADSQWEAEKEIRAYEEFAA